MKRGSIYWINLEPTEPPELGKVRPGLVISNSEQNSLLKSVVVIPLSTKSGEIWPLRVKVKIPKQKESFAVIPGIRQVSKQRFRDFLGLCSEEGMERVHEALSLYLSETI
jgi:mRNA interferase MazF